MSLDTMKEKIRSREDLSHFINALKDDLQANTNEWSNSDLASFLEAMAAWVVDMDGYYKNIGKPFSEEAQWNSFGDILYAAKSYE